MKTIIIITLLTLTGCATFEDDIRDMHVLASDCSGIATITATKTNSDDRISYACTWEQVRL